MVDVLDGRIAGKGAVSLAGEMDRCFCLRGMSEFGCLERGFSDSLDCILAIANSRSIIFTSSVVRRCSRVTLSSCCMVWTKDARFEGRAGS